MGRQLTIGELNPGDTFRFRGDLDSDRWIISESPQPWRRYHIDRTLCIPTPKNSACDGNMLQCYAYPDESVVIDVRRSKKHGEI